MLTCLAIDDEPLALQIIEDYVAKVPGVELIAATTDAIQGLEIIRSRKPDVVFLDVQMPDINGVQLINLAGAETKYILTTAYPEYALQGYELNVADYLLKPFAFDRFYKALERIKGLTTTGAPAATETKTEPGRERNYLFVKQEYRMHKVPFDDILYVEGLKDYISIYTRDKRLVMLQTMKNMEDTLPGKDFARIHRSFIVALDKIESVEKSKIKIGEAVLPIGDTYRDAFFNAINKSL